MPQLDDLRGRLEDARAELSADRAANTIRGYAYDWQRFEAWCGQFKLTPLPAAPETLALYVIERLGQNRKTTAVSRDIASIVAKHADAGLPTPASAELWAILDRTRRQRLEQRRQMLPLRLEDVRAIAEHLATKGTRKATRNRAIILVGFASALRGSTLGEIGREDIDFCAQGAILHVRREKQDQACRGRLIGLPYGRHVVTCPVHALKDWLKLRGDAPGPVFGLACNSIRVIVKQCVGAIGRDPAEFGSHSMRSGFCTVAGENGAGELLIASQTGHRTMEVLRQYFRHTELFRANACALLGL